MEYNRTLFDLLIEGKLQSADGIELRSVLRTKIQEGQLCLDQFKCSLKHCEAQIREIDNYLKQTVTSPQRKSLLEKRAAFITVKHIWNFAAQIQLLSTECKALQEKLYFAESEWDKSYQSRQACNYMYEYGNNLNKMMGKEFLEIVSSLLGTDGAEEMKRLKKPISKFFKENEEYYYSVRNRTTAHRSQDSLQQINTITSSEWSGRIQELHEFEAMTLPLGGFAQRMIVAGMKMLERVFKD